MICYSLSVRRLSPGRAWAVPLTRVALSRSLFCLFLELPAAGP